MKYNFFAGPSKLFPSVKKQLAEGILNYNNSGLGIAEISHRSKLYVDLHKATLDLVRRLLNVPDNYTILLLPGGASIQFSAIPLNLRVAEKEAAYIETGHFSSLAIDEATKYTKVRVINSSRNTEFSEIPTVDEVSKEYSYCHITYNNTDTGIQYKSLPEKLVESKVPIIADMSSCIFSQKINVSDFGMIYAGTQKNLGISGMTLVIIRNDLLNRNSSSYCPLIYNYKIQVLKNNLVNTPATVTVYAMYLTLKYIEEVSLENIEKLNIEKAELLYNYINKSNFYRVLPEKDLSIMNIVFTINNSELNDKFVKEAEAKGFYGLKGHKSRGGLRASIYNACTYRDVQALIKFMKEFKKENTNG